MVKILITLSIVAIISISSFGFAGEMERSTLNTNTDQTLKLMDSNFRWQDNQVKYYQKEMERAFIKSVPNPSDKYVADKFENDVRRVSSTLISIGTAAGGGLISAVGAGADVLHNFGPQKGPIQEVTGRVGDVITTVDVFRTGRDFIKGNFSEAAIGGVGLMNSAFGRANDAQKKNLMQPITTSSYKEIPFKYNDGFTRVESVGSVNVTNTYDAPPFKPFGVPDIFDIPTKTVTNSQWKSTVTTGSFNNNLNMNNNMNFITPTFVPPTFNHNFNMPSFNVNNFSGIR